MIAWIRGREMKGARVSGPVEMLGWFAGGHNKKIKRLQELYGPFWYAIRWCDGWNSRLQALPREGEKKLNAPVSEGSGNHLVRREWRFD